MVSIVSVDRGVGVLLLMGSGKRARNEGTESARLGCITKVFQMHQL